jgi:hypothetical protein
MLCNAAFAHAGLTLKIADPKTYGHKTILKMELLNTFTNNIDSVRAAVFLLDENGKIVGQETRWIVGGTKERPGLAHHGKTTFHFVLQSSKPFAKTRVTINRIVMEGGRLADIHKDVQIESITK